jgi:hypothetical protein
VIFGQSGVLENAGLSLIVPDDVDRVCTILSERVAFPGSEDSNEFNPNRINVALALEKCRAEIRRVSEETRQN